MTSAWTALDDHVRLSVRLTPSGGRDRLEGPEQSDDGTVWLKARVSAPPEDGKANRALVVLLSRTFRIPKSSIRFLCGETARKKILRLDVDPEDFRTRFEAL